MARIRLITERGDALSSDQARVFDAIVESRGKMLRPYEVLLHAPTIAEALSELGARIRFAGSLPDHDRELVILTAAAVHGCEFEWDTHLPIAIEAGVRPEVITHLEGVPTELTDMELLVIEYVQTLCAESTVPADMFERAREHFGDGGVIELTAAVGYYTLLAYVMRATDTC